VKAGRRSAVAVVNALAVSVGVLSVSPGRSSATPDLRAPMAAAAETDPVRQTEGEAFALAAQTGARVEIAAYRGEARSVYANPDGSLTDEDYAEPVRVLRDGHWVDASPELVPVAGGRIEPRAAAFGLSLSADASGPLLTAERGGRKLMLSWPDAKISGPPKLEGSRATYSEVLPGVDLVIDVGVTSFSR
jgi:hypothetical protein